MHKTTERFWKCFYKLPKSVQLVAQHQFDLLKSNPHHPSLHFKKIGELWSVRISLNYRALATKEEEDYIWVWIGKHKDYERMLQ